MSRVGSLRGVQAIPEPCNSNSNSNSNSKQRVSYACPACQGTCIATAVHCRYHSCACLNRPNHTADATYVKQLVYTSQANPIQLRTTTTQQLQAIYIQLAHMHSRPQAVVDTVNFKTCDSSCKRDSIASAHQLGRRP
jgi:hypothetical protein